MAGLQVDMPVPGNIMRNVGDMHAQLIAALGRALERDGIIKVACINRIDGDDKAIAQITTKRVFKRCSHIERKRLCLCQSRFGIAVGIAIARHNILDAQIGRIVTADAALKSHRARLQARRVGQNARDDDITRMHAQALRRSVLGQNKEIGFETRIERLDHTKRAGRLIRTHHADGGTLDDALDHGTTIPTRSRLDAYGHGIAVHNLTLTAAHDLVIAVVGHDISAVLMELHAASHARATLAAHRPAFIACATLMFVIAPHGASLLSIAVYTPRVYPNDPLGTEENGSHR